MVETRQRDRVAECEVRRDPAYRSNLAFDVVEPDIAFRRRIEFENPERSEPVNKRPPHFFRKPVADCYPQPMSLLLGPDRGGYEKVAEFPDILNARAFPTRDIIPKAAR